MSHSNVIYKVTGTGTEIKKKNSAVYILSISQEERYRKAKLP